MNSNLNHGKIIAVAGNQATAADVVEALQRAGYRIDFWLNVGPEHAEGIADYHDFEAEARRRDIRLLRPPTYAMRDEASRALFENARIDLLISVGWQRLFPRWFLERLSIGAFGMHGSAEPLPRGRGRSPMVWSILENRDRFFTNLFRYDEGVDSGEIVATQRFDVLASDTIQTLQHKNALAQIQLLEKHLPALLRGDAPLRPQPADLEPTYYPKRIPEDGVVDWSDSACRIDRLVRAVTRPYPGAFTFAEGKKIMIWEGSPFDRHLKLSAAPGEIAAAFHDGTFLVQCGDFAYWIKTWEGPAGWRPQKGDRFESRPNPSWKKLESMRVAGGSEPPFTFEGYGQLLEALKSGGYRSTLFQEDDGAEGRVLLRHDIDKDPIAALRLAEAEAGAGFRASYFFLLRCPLYSVLEPEGVEPIRAIAGLGHSVGLHCDERRMLRGQLCDRDRFDEAVRREVEMFRAAVGSCASNIVSFHNPSAGLLGRAGDGYLSAYEPRFQMPATKYLSDSNARWREGPPLQALRERRWPRLQILTHPIWWARESQEEPLAVLKRAVERRHREIDEYLRYSNDLWRQAAGSDE